MDIYKILQKMYPQLSQDIDYIVADHSDGKGPQLTWLNKKVVEPTREELEPVWVEIQVEQKAKKLKEQKAIDILKALNVRDKQEAIIDQINLIQEALATGDNTKVIAVRDAIQKILTA